MAQLFSNKLLPLFLEKKNYLFQNIQFYYSFVFNCSLILKDNPHFMKNLYNHVNIILSTNIHLQIELI